MSGRTFTYTTGFDSFVKTLMPEMQAPVRRKAGGVGDGMLRDVEEFINRFCVTAANDDGDLTFDSAGTYTFDGDLVVNGASTLNGTSTINGSSTINGDATVAGDMTLTSAGAIQTGSSGERVVIANDAPGYVVPGVWMWPSDTPDRPGAIFSSESGSVYTTNINPPFDIADSYARISMSNNNTGYIWGQWDMEIANGSAGTPSLCFETDTDTGMYRYGTNEIGFTAAGTVRFRVGTTAHISTEPFQTADGSTSTCAYSFSSDTNTGMFRNSGSSFLGFAWNGSTGLAIRSTDVIPGSDNTKNLGDTSFRWVDVWAVDSTINTSDSRDKREVTDLDLGLDFVLQLRPVHYKWNDRGGYVGTRKHHGFVAQEVAAALGPEAANRGLWISAPGKPANPGMPGGKPTPPREALRPAELIPVLTKAIQELAARVEALETP